LSSRANARDLDFSLPLEMTREGNPLLVKVP
jgi:hypothetical protein